MTPWIRDFWYSMHDTRKRECVQQSQWIVFWSSIRKRDGVIHGVPKLMYTWVRVIYVYGDGGQVSAVVVVAGGNCGKCVRVVGGGVRGIYAHYVISCMD